ncbi:porin [Hydrogenophaga sp.]|uniref:porin n=1 Tax=Hydrogenophaga sp. TaxID=1904254 RepID=UPI0035B20718
MKKTLIALAAVAATSASFAQSSVTLSGLVDVGIEKQFSGAPTKMAANRNATSNWTLSGTEDLGGGLKAVFKASTSFNSDDGTLASANAFGNNDMFVGLTGNFGTLRAGRPINTLYGNAFFANGTKGVTGYDANTLLAGLVANAGSSVFVANAVQYHSPRFAGFQVQVEYAPSELANADDGFGLGIRYDNGPLSASLVSYEGAGTAALLKPKSVTQLGAAYDFSVAKVFFTYRDDSNKASTADTGYALGVTAPVGPGSLYASYNVAEAAGSDKRSIIAGYKYNLSKRTQAYFQLANGNAALNVSGAATAKSSNGYGFGLTHSF